VITKLAGEPLADRAAREAYFAAAATISSDYYRQQAIDQVIERHERDSEILREVAKAAGGISEDYYKAQVLSKLAGRASGDAALRDAIVEAARTISSDYYRGEVLSKVFT